MADSKAKSFAGQIQALMETRPDFSRVFKQRLVFQSSKVANPFKFIQGLLAKGVLADESNDSEGNFGLKEWMVQLATTMACSKEAGGIGGLMEALEESGNRQLISGLRTWAKEDFGIVTDDEKSELNSVIVQTSNSEMEPKWAKSAIELSSSAIKLIDKILSHEGADLLINIEGHLVGVAPRILNSEEFCSSLVHQNLIEESDVQLKAGPGVQVRRCPTRAIKAACSKKAIGALFVAFQSSGNGHILEETLEWLETSQAKSKNYPIAVKNSGSQRLKQESQAVRRTFFEQPAPLNGLLKVATYYAQPDSTSKETVALEFDREGMTASFEDCTAKVWTWQDGKENTIKFGVPMKFINCFQFDADILILGTADGTVHLFDARTSEEKWSVRLGQPVESLKFVESALVVITESVDLCDKEVWWLEISRSDMRLLNQRSIYTRRNYDNIESVGVYMYPDITFVYFSVRAYVHDTKTGTRIFDGDRNECYLRVPSIINTLSFGDLISTKRVVVAGCIDGRIAMWSTYKLINGQSPVKTFREAKEKIVSLCFLNGHLLSLDRRGKLLMWSGYDLENKKVTSPIPRVLVQDLANAHATSLFACERWFATSSSVDGIVNIWTLPELWLRTG